MGARIEVVVEASDVATATVVVVVEAVAVIVDVVMIGTLMGSGLLIIIELLLNCMGMK
jgi:hypothetical protein